MVMMKVENVGPLLDSKPARDSTDFRNAWQTVEARLKSTKAEDKRASLLALRDRLAAIGEPQAPARMTRAEALERAHAVNRARAIGRSRAAILRRVERSRFGHACISSDKPTLFEAALQMIEDGEVSFRSREVGGSRGPVRAEGSPPLRRIWVGLPGFRSEWICDWKSERRQAEEAKI